MSFHSLCELVKNYSLHIRAIEQDPLFILFAKAKSAFHEAVKESMTHLMMLSATREEAIGTLLTLLIPGYVPGRESEYARQTLERRAYAKVATRSNLAPKLSLSRHKLTFQTPHTFNHIFLTPLLFLKKRSIDGERNALFQKS